MYYFYTAMAQLHSAISERKKITPWRYTLFSLHIAMALFLSFPE
jgi:hypothetical protein